MEEDLSGSDFSLVLAEVRAADSTARRRRVHQRTTASDSDVVG